MKTLSFAALVVIGLIVNGCGGGARPGGEAGSEPSERSADNVVQRLQSAGAPIDASQKLTAANDSNELLGRPGQYTGKILFHDARLSTKKDTLNPSLIDTDAGGSIEIFESEEDAKRRAVYVRAFTEGVGAFAEYNYLRGAIFVRVTGKLTPDQVRVYERASASL